MKHYIVGDIHGEYKSLLNLIAKIPNDSRLVFVGDLIDRGAESAQVIRFIREHGFQCVKGNHEEMMIEYGSAFISSIEQGELIDQENMWLKHGGVETLLSYGLISLQGDRLITHPFIKEFIFQFKEDIEWMKTLPIYLELSVTHSSGRNVVISHSSIAPVWHMRNDKREEKVFRETALWSRTIPLDKQNIFNIFGHTPHRYSIDEKKHYVNVDTGCYKKDEKGYGLLSAYCVESGEVYSSGELSGLEEKVS